MVIFGIASVPAIFSAPHLPASSPSSPNPKEKLNNKSIQRQTTSPDNSNMLHMFNNNIYTDFGTVYKHVLIPSYVIRVI